MRLIAPGPGTGRGRPRKPGLVRGGQPAHLPGSPARPLCHTSHDRLIGEKHGISGVPSRITGQPATDVRCGDLPSRVPARFETTPTSCSLDTADDALLTELAQAHGWSAPLPQRLVERGLVTRDAGHDMLTVAGALYLLREPERELGRSYIEVFRYRDDAATTEDKRYRITGPLPHQVIEATARVTEEIGTDVAVVGLHRYELERIPLPVLREAVANAVAHRVYEDNRRCVRIEIRPTKVRIVSPGPLPEPVTVQNIREQNAARNTEVIATLRRFRLAEDTGRGIDVMQDVMAERLLDPPHRSSMQMPSRSPSIFR